MRALQLYETEVNPVFMICSNIVFITDVLQYWIVSHATNCKMRQYTILYNLAHCKVTRGYDFIKRTKDYNIIMCTTHSWSTMYPCTYWSTFYMYDSC